MKVITTNLLNRFWKNGVKPIKDDVAKKLNTSNIINNLLATAAGYALDARQGKILNDKITELNGKLPGDFFSNQKTVTIPSKTSTNLYQYTLKGGIYDVKCNIAFGSDISALVALNIAKSNGLKTTTVRGSMASGGGLFSGCMIDARNEDVTVTVSTYQSNTSGVTAYCEFSYMRIAK